MNKATADTLYKILSANMGKDSVTIHTIFGERIEMTDVTDVTGIDICGREATIEVRENLSITTSIGEPEYDYNVLPFKYITHVIDEDKYYTHELYRKKDPLFDAIKKYLGYKMHETEIWTIVEMARDIVPKTE